MMSLNWKVLTPLSMLTLLVTALIDKSIPTGQTLLKIGVLLAANILMWVFADRLISYFTKRHPVQVVSGPRPLARPEPNVETPETPGAVL